MKFSDKKVQFSMFFSHFQKNFNRKLFKHLFAPSHPQHLTKYNSLLGIKHIIIAVTKINGVGTVPVGRVESGTMLRGMTVVFSPTSLTSEVQSIEMHRIAIIEVIQVDIIGFKVRSIPPISTSRSHIVHRSDDHHKSSWKNSYRVSARVQLPHSVCYIEV
jgi:translation elongation factor EF-1alpha